MTYPGLRCLEPRQSLSDPAVPSLRFVPTQQLPQGAIVWVDDERDYYHFERYSARPDDGATVINGFNGGKWIKGAANASRTIITAEGDDATVLGGAWTEIVSAEVPSTAEGDELWAHVQLHLSSPGNESYLTVYTQWEFEGTLYDIQRRWMLHNVAEAGSCVVHSDSVLYTVGASPADPLVVRFGGIGGESEVAHYPRLTIFSVG